MIWNFRTIGSSFGIVRREGFFLVPKDAATSTYTVAGEEEGSGTGWSLAGSSSRRSKRTNDVGGGFVPATSDRCLDKAYTRRRHRVSTADSMPRPKYVLLREEWLRSCNPRRWTIETGFADMEKVLE